MSTGTAALLVGLTFDWRLALVVAATLLGGFLRGFVGFGAALVSVPVISLVVGPRVAVAVVTIMGLPSIVQLLPDALRNSERSIVLPMALAIFVATPIGTWILVSVDPAIMKMVISAAVVVLVGFLSLGWKLGQKVGNGVLLLAGAAGGVVQGVAGIGGPPVVAVALARAGPPERQRGNVLAVMTAIVLSSLPPLYAYGLFTRQAILIGLLLIPIYFVGTLFGRRYFSAGGSQHYRRAALGMLAAIGLTTLIVAVWSYARG
ncbi:MAG: sulfite exporter TauE/SafE family protein [Hyphomicrobiaceae bacterium]